MKKNDSFSRMMMAWLAVIALSFVSCVDKDEVVFTDLFSSSAVLTVDKYYLEFNYGDGPKVVTITSEEEWEYSVNDTWAHVSREEGSDKLSIQVDKNRTKDTRECVLTIRTLSSAKSQSQRTVTIKQTTSLVTITCSDTELNFSSYEGASKVVSIYSNGDWSVKSTPDWIRASVSGGNGDKALTFKTLSANKSSDSRSGVIVIRTIDEEVQLQVLQYGGAVANCRVAPKNITVLSNGIAFDMDYSHASNVAHYYRGYMEASRAGIMTNQEIISKLKNEFKRYLPSDDEVADFSGLMPNTKYIIYTLAFDIDGKSGELLSTEVKTCPLVNNEPCGWINNMYYTDNTWEWSITKSATCYSYWMMTTEDPDVAGASDVLQAWWLEDAVRRNQVTEYYNGGDWQQRRRGSVIAIWTRGKSANGTLAGKISWDYISTITSAKARRSPSQTVTKRNVVGDHSGKKLSDNQYQLYLMK